MSLKSKIEAVIYASEEPVTLQQLVGLLAEEAQAELDDIAASQATLLLDGDEPERVDASPERILLEAGTHEPPQVDATAHTAIGEGEIAFHSADGNAPAVAEVLEAADDIKSSVSAEVPSGQGSEQGTPGAETRSGEPEVLQQPTLEDERRSTRDRERAVREHIRRAVGQLIREYAGSDRGIEIREVASGFRMGTKPEYHDAVRGFVKSLKPALKLTLPALETLAVVAYKQPVTAAEISEIRGVDSAGVLGGLMARKLIATAGRKQVIGRPMLYKTTRDFLLRFGLKDVGELPSMEEFERMAGELAEQEDLPMDSPDTIIEQANVRGDAEMIRDVNAVGDALDEGRENNASHDNNESHATAEIAAGGNLEAANQQVSESASQPVEAEEEHAR